jgi:hypothetical protein
MVFLLEYREELVPSGGAEVYAALCGFEKKQQDIYFTVKR